MKPSFFAMICLLGGAVVGPVAIELSDSYAGVKANADPTFAELVRGNMAFPFWVTLKQDCPVIIVGRGFTTINAGVSVKVTDLTKDGMLKVEFADETVTLPMEQTNVMDLALLLGNWIFRDPAGRGIQGAEA